MSPWERWKKVSINNKLMIYMTAILAVATTLYTLMYRSQVKFMKENATQTAEQTNRLVNASERLAQTTNNTLEEAKRVNKETGDRADRTTKAIEIQANASMSQAGTSRITAGAARESSQFARQSYEASQTAKVFFTTNKWREKPTATNTHVLADFGESNAGATAYDVTTEFSTVIRPSSFHGMLPCNNTVVEKGLEGPMQPGAVQTIVTDVEYRMTEQDEKAMDAETLMFLVYGHVWWNDSLGRKSSFPFCRTYNKRGFPMMAICPRTINIPDCTKH
jgi:hypothetical protein